MYLNQREKGRTYINFYRNILSKIYKLENILIYQRILYYNFFVIFIYLTLTLG